VSLKRHEGIESILRDKRVYLLNYGYVNVLYEGKTDVFITLVSVELICVC